MQYNVIDYLEKSAGKFSDKTAVSDICGSFTYSQLRDNSRRIATVLSKIIFPSAPVAVMLEKGVKALCAFYGTVYAGGFYVYFNSELPEKRLEKMQTVLDAQVVIADAETLELAKKIFSGKKILLADDLLCGEINEESLCDRRMKLTDNMPLYANFTSGSTGTPKAVAVSHRSVIDFIDELTEMSGMDSSDIVGNQAPFDFDVSVKDIYSAAATGAELVIIPRELFSKPKDLLDFICDHNITTMIWAVSALCLISTFHGLDYRTPEKVRRVMFSGEVMPSKHLKSWLEKLPDADFVNLYGPTEITCNCTYHKIDRKRDYSDGIPIGRAFQNEKVFLLDENDKEVTEQGAEGEICVSGSCLALGYYGDKVQTDNVFVQNPLNSAFYERIYRTGDLGRYNKSGELMFCGRKDFQIKYKGHRIELEEIERAVNACNDVERCCCVFDAEKEKLYCFYVGEAEKSDIHAQLRGILPLFMVPSAFRKAESLPITKNGKTDRKLLLESVKRR